MAAQKVTLKLPFVDEEQKQKAMSLVASFLGVDSVSVEMKDSKLIFVGRMDPVKVVRRLQKKFYETPINVDEVVLAKQEKKKEEPKKGEEKKGEEKKGEEKKKEENKKDPKNDCCSLLHNPYGLHYHPHLHPYYYGKPVEEDQFPCVIC